MHDQGGYYTPFTSTKDEEIENKIDCPKRRGPTPVADEEWDDAMGE